MALITKVDKEETRPISIKLEVGLADRLTAYSEYLNRSRDEIVAIVLTHVMRNDKEFTSIQATAESPGQPRSRKRSAKAAAGK